jgi:hypothetical protein
MRFQRICAAIGLAVCLGAARPKEHIMVEDRKTAPDGITTGWVLTYDNPQPGQEWRRYPLRLVIARRGKVIRRWDITTVLNWAFWNGGHEVIVEAGGMHGPADCIRKSVDTGKDLATFANCTEDAPGAPDWAKVVEP